MQQTSPTTGLCFDSREMISCLLPWVLTQLAVERPFVEKCWWSSVVFQVFGNESCRFCLG